MNDRKDVQLQIRGALASDYADVFTPEVTAALSALAHFNRDRMGLMVARIERRAARARNRERITFLDPDGVIPRTSITVRDAREGRFAGAEIPADLQRQWIQGTGPGARPRTSIEQSIRNVAYALLSGADGWMFDGEDALGQVSTMALDNQRNLKLAIAHNALFLQVAEQVAGEMNTWAQGFLGRPIIQDWRTQLDFTTKIFRARGLHLDDRHVRCADGSGFSASIVDTVLYVVNNQPALRAAGASIVLYLPKIQTAEEAALWNDILTALEHHVGMSVGTIKVYVLVEQLEASFQLMEIRAALGHHFVGYNTGRWDYINSVADAMAWDSEFLDPNIDAITMTYGYMRHYEDRVRRAVNTPDLHGRCALWQGGMEPNIPVGSEAGVDNGMKRAVAGGEREQREGASGKWVAHWKMVHIVRPVWERAGEANQLGRGFPRLTYEQADADGLLLLEPAPRTVRGARDLLSVALQYGNAFGQGFQAAALKPADFFGNDDILYLMEDMATGEIRLSILWEWLRKGAALTEDDPETGVKADDRFTPELFARLLDEEYDKLRRASNRDVHDVSKDTTLPIAREIVATYVRDDVKPPWYIDLLNINLDNDDVAEAKRRIRLYMDAFRHDGTRITENLDFDTTTTAGTAEARPRTNSQPKTNSPPKSNSPPKTLESTMSVFERQVAEAREWFASPRFAGIVRLYSPREVAQQQGTIDGDYTVARQAAERFYARLRELFERRQSITTFGPYSPGQAVTMKRLGIEGIYLGGWATSARGSIHEDPGADLASYPLSQVPNEAALIVRALLTADRNQHFARSRMSEAQRAATSAVDFHPFIIADADTGHGGDAHVRNLIRRFVEVGVPGYHIEDQKPGVKKCGHQGGKVLVAEDEQIKRLNAARLQLDIMKVPGMIVARTDAESATFLEGRGDERDQPFILGATNVELPSYKAGYVAILRKLSELGIEEIRGHLLFAMSEAEYAAAFAWLERTGLIAALEESAAHFKADGVGIDVMLDGVVTRFVDLWQAEAGLKTYGRAIADVMDFRANEGERFGMSVDEWMHFAARASFYEAREKAKSMGIHTIWDCELPKTPEGFYQIRGGIDYAITKSLAAAPFADLLWMETKTASLEDARQFADAIHAVYPDKMLAYNLSPSFNWDTTGMSDEEMRRFPDELGKLGFVFNFITYGGHQIDGLAADEFATALQQDGMLALARLQRKFRLLESPYRTPQTLVGGPRLDGALMASSGRTATTKSMGKGSTQFQHLVQTEVPPKLLEEWLEIWRKHYDVQEPLGVELRPHTAGSELLELRVLNGSQSKLANVVFASIQDRRGRSILSVRDQNTFEITLRKKRLMTLIHLFLIHRYKASSVHYVTPTEDNQYQTQKMWSQGIFTEVNTEVGQIIVADVNAERISQLLAPDGEALESLIRKVAPAV
jgi:isocitrate lyase